MLRGEFGHEWKYLVSSSPFVRGMNILNLDTFWSCDISAGSCGTHAGIIHPTIDGTDFPMQLMK